MLAFLATEAIASGGPQEFDGGGVVSLNPELAREAVISPLTFRGPGGDSLIGRGRVQQHQTH